ncbi:MAG TPA: outer membrane lipoprotein-sorting protein [Myxococcota bacterium]|nr:outer membrane lipoprotein-sorting protein [Myxococcota bacterium]
MAAAAALLTALAGPARAGEVEDLLRGVDDLNRGASAHSVVEMQVHTASYDRTMRMEAWSQGTDNTLIRILYPEKDAGISTLKVGDNLWNYLPKVDRTIKVPAGMMSGAWMGSHVTNDDLVHDSRLSDDFTYTITGRPTNGTGQWVIELVPKPDAPVVWGKIVAKINADKLPDQMTYYDEGGALVRTMAWSKVETFDGRRMPSTFTITPADKPGEFTTVRQLAIDFDAAVDPSTFTLQALKP